ncbi:type II secretion system F family protein [Streptomyces sp. NPDC002851]
MSADVVHRLGVAVAPVVGVAGAVVLARAWAVGLKERKGRRRARLMFGTGPPVPRRLPRWGPAATRRLTVAGAVCAGYAVVGGVAGCLVGAGAGYAVWRWLRRGGPADVPGRAEAERQLPLAADLMTSCIAAGAEPVAAAEAVGESLEGPFGRRLVQAAAELRLGAEPERAWGRLAEIPGARPLARCLERAGASGAPAAEQMALIAAECRATRARTAAARARRASVVIVAPVGLCLLPAFLAIGVVPVAVGLAGGFLNGN